MNVASVVMCFYAQDVLRFTCFFSQSHSTVDCFCTHRTNLIYCWWCTRLIDFTVSFSCRSCAVVLWSRALDCVCVTTSHQSVHVATSHASFVSFCTRQYACALRTLAQFYARQHICYSAYMPRQFRMSVRPSVCLSHACIVSKRLNVSSKFVHHLFASTVRFSGSADLMVTLSMTLSDPEPQFQGHSIV